MAERCVKNKGLAMGKRTFLALVVLVQLEALERGGAGDQLVGEFSLVVWIVIPAILLVDLLVGILGVVWVYQRAVSTGIETVERRGGVKKSDENPPQPNIFAVFVVSLLVERCW